MLTGDKNFYRTFLRLCFTLMLEQAVILSVNLADNIMLGKYTESAMSGVAAVNQIQFVFQQLVYGIGNAVIILGSQYRGKGRVDEVRRIASLGIRLELILAAVLFVLVSVFPKTALKVFTANPDYIRDGISYLKIIRWSYFFFALTAVLLSSLRVVEAVKIALGVSLVSLVVNVSINWALIFDRPGFTGMGARGAAIGTLAARIVELILVTVYVLRDRKLALRPSDLCGTDRDLLKDFARVSGSVLGAAFLWGIANALQTVTLGHMDDSAIGAQSISNTAFLLLKVTSVGAASAASVIIGKTVGENDRKRLREYVCTLQVIFIGIGVLLALVMLGIRLPLLSLYRDTITPATYKLAGNYILIQAAVLFTMSYQMPTNTGIIRGGGDARFILILDTVNIVVFITLAMLGGLVWNWSAIAVIIILNIDQALKCIPAAIYANSYRWVRHLTRGEEEAKKEG